jgi:hypothetical protein
MNRFVFQCVHCFRDIEAPEDMRGQVTKCIHCEGEIRVPGLGLIDPKKEEKEEDNEAKNTHKNKEKTRFIMVRVICGILFISAIFISLLSFLSGQNILIIASIFSMIFLSVGLVVIELLIKISQMIKNGER